MTRRPWHIGLLLALGALALLYNVWTYSHLFMEPNSSSMSSMTQNADESETEADDEASADVTARLPPMSDVQVASFIPASLIGARNPFEFVAPPGENEGASEASDLPVVQGILRGEGRRVAWINGRACTEGEEVDGHVLIRIELDRVFVERGGLEYELSPVR